MLAMLCQQNYPQVDHIKIITTEWSRKKCTNFNVPSICNHSL